MVPKRILGAGLITADHIFIQEKEGKRGSKPKYLGTTGGGSVGNTLCMLSLLGHECSVFGVVGNDPISDVIKNDFNTYHVGNSLLSRRGGPHRIAKSRQYSHVIYESTNRHSFHQDCKKCGEKFSRNFHISPSDLSEAVLHLSEKSDLVHFDRANNIMLEIASKCDSEGGKISLDIGYVSRQNMAGTESLIRMCSLVKINERILKNVTDEMGREALNVWLQKFPQNSILIVTRGRDGVYGYADSKSGRCFFDLLAIECKTLRDAGGAGDVLMATLISELLLQQRKMSESSIQRSINRAQALASLNCSLYGARALHRAFLVQNATKSEIISTADDILKEGFVGNSFSARVGIPPQYGYAFRFVPEAFCSVCGSSHRRRSRRRASVPSTSFFNKILERAPLVMSQSFELSLTHRDSLRAFRESPTIFVGSGGSYSAAAFGEQLLLKLSGITSKALAPFQFENMTELRPEVPVCLLSYGGSNPDIIGAAIRVARAGIKNCLVMCGNKNSELSRIAKDRSWDLIMLPGELRGFVATIGLLSMITSLISFLTQKRQIEEIEDQLGYKACLRMMREAIDVNMRLGNVVRSKSASHVIGLASGWGWPALIDFESKIVEGGLCTIEIAEIKNFTHGRYINAFSHMKNREMMIFESPEEKELSNFIQQRFKRRIPVNVLCTEKKGPVGGLELVARSLLLAIRIGNSQGKDISSPKYPKEARGLYAWTPSYRKGIPFVDVLNES